MYNCTGAFLSGSLPCDKAFMLLVNVLCNQTHFLLLLCSCVNTCCTVLSSLAEVLKITNEMMFFQDQRDPLYSAAFFEKANLFTPLLGAHWINYMRTFNFYFPMLWGNTYIR
jgi:hypothetical protein